MDSNLKWFERLIPEWWGSIRSLVTLILTGGWLMLMHEFIQIVSKPNATPETVVMLSSLATVYNTIYILTLNYYFKDKQRNGDIK